MKTGVYHHPGAKIAALVLLLLLLFCALAWGQPGHFSFTTAPDSNGGLIITGFSSPGSGPLAIPGTINGLPVRGIGDSAFRSSEVTSVTIPNTVISIGAGAFLTCTSLTTVTIPGSVTRIGDSAFYDCYSLTSITVSPQNTVYSSRDGVLFNKDQTTLLQYPGGASRNYAIPNTVTRIGDHAFDQSTNLMSVTIPNSVTRIGDSAFYDCYSLTSVAIPNSVTHIGDYSFALCSGLASVMIPDSVTSIGKDAFSYCSNLTNVTIPESVTSIGDSAFNYCNSLRSAIFMGNAPAMGADVFDGSASSFTVYYVYGATGFTSPVWMDSSGDTYRALKLLPAADGAGTVGKKQKAESRK